MVTDVRLTFQSHKNKLVSFETHHSDKIICGDVQRLLTTELRFVYGDLLCLPHQLFLDDWHKVFSKRRIFVTNLRGFIYLLISVKFYKSYKMRHLFFSGFETSLWPAEKYNSVWRALFVGVQWRCCMKSGLVNHLDLLDWVSGFFVIMLETFCSMQRN